MPVDQNRYEQYQTEMTALSKGLSAKSHMKVVRSKVLDFLSKNAITIEASYEVKRLVQTLLDDELTTYLNKLNGKYDQVIEMVNTIYSDLGVEVTRNFNQIYAIERVNASEIGEFEDGVARRISDAVRKAAIEKTTPENLAKTIAAFSDKSAIYAETIAKTQLKGISRVAKNEKAYSAEVFVFEYVGHVRDVTRAFCRALSGTSHHLDTIHELRNGNREPVMENCGGWNCIHDWEPDPFATETDPSELIEINEGTRRIILPGGPDMATKYRAAKETSRRAALRNN